MMSPDAALSAAGSLHLQALIDRAPIRPIQIQVILLCALVTLVEGIDLNIIPLLAPAIARSWALPSTEFGIIFSSGPVGLIIGGLTVGWWADRFGRRNALIGAMIIMTVATLATAWTTTVPQLLVCRVLTGIGFGGVLPAATALVSEFLPTRTRASVVAFVILGQSLGGLVMSLLMKGVAATIHWQTLILYMGIMCAVVLVVLFPLLPESPRYLLLRDPDGHRTKAMLARLRLSETPAPEAPSGERAGAFDQLTELFRHGRAPGTLLIWLFFIGVCAVVSFFTNWLTLIVSDSGLGADAGVSASAAYWAGGIVSGIILPLFALRWHVNWVLTVSILAASVFTSLMGLSLGWGADMRMVVAFSCGIFISGSFYLLYPPVVRFYPTAIRSTGVGTAIAVGRIGNTVSPLAASGLIAAGFGADRVFLVMALPLLVSCGALIVFHRMTKDRAEA